MPFRVLILFPYKPRLSTVKERKRADIFFVTKQILPRTKETVIIERANLPRSHYFRLMTDLAPRYDIYHIFYWTLLLSCYFVPGPKKIYEPRGWQVGFGFKHVRDFASPRGKVLGLILDKLVKFYMLNVDRLVAGSYLSEEAIKFRKDTVLLHAPVDFNIFNPSVKPESLEGDPAIFLPTRLDRIKGVAEAW